MDQEKPGANGSVTTLRIAPRIREVPPLTNKEILQLRELLKKADLIEGHCPIAQRALSKR
jgi:hypothetical protein